jgi:SAM-dependent methyltransferase
VSTADLYQHIYRNGDRVPGYDRYWKYAVAVRQAPDPLDYLATNENTYWAVKQALGDRPQAARATRILEIGSGLGYLTYALIKAGYQAQGLDISQVAVQAATEAFGDHYICADVLGFARRNPGAFDVAVLTDVIEHVEEPVGFLRAIVSLLRPGGQAIVTTPNKSFFQPGVVWMSELPPVHCWWFSEGSMQEIARALKLDLSFLNFREYYKRHYHGERTSVLTSRPLPKPYLDRSGELLPLVRNGQRSWRSGLINKAAWLKWLYGSIMERCALDFAVCRDRGVLLCALLRKNGGDAPAGQAV